MFFKDLNTILIEKIWLEPEFSCWNSSVMKINGDSISMLIHLDTRVDVASCLPISRGVILTLMIYQQFEIIKVSNFTVVTEMLHNQTEY